MAGPLETSLFDLLSLFYAVLGLRAIFAAAKNWRAFTDDQLTAADRRLAAEIAFFVFIPIGVLLHELGHAAATYQMGGTLNWLGGGFHYALFWGYVVPEGNFTPLQDWWIALSGNLVSVLYGFLPLLFLKWTDKAWIKYTLLSLARIQLGWSLVGYPLITLTGIDSDWSTIYSTQTLAVSAPLFVVHAALVAVLWRLDRSARVRRWEVSLYAGAGPTLRSLDAAIAARPGAVDPLIARGNFLASQGQFDLAIADYRAVLKIDPQNPRALYNIGQLQLMRKRYAAAEKSFRAALARAGHENPTGPRPLAAQAHYGLGLSLYHRGAAAQAVAEFDVALAGAGEDAELHFWRGLARRAVHEDAGARADFQRAAELAATANPDLAARARAMLGPA